MMSKAIRATPTYPSNFGPLSSEMSPSSISSFYISAHSNRSPKTFLLYTILSCVPLIGPTCQLCKKRERRSRERMRSFYISGFRREKWESLIHRARWGFGWSCVFKSRAKKKDSSSDESLVEVALIYLFYSLCHVCTAIVHRQTEKTTGKKKLAREDRTREKNSTGKKKF